MSSKNNFIGKKFYPSSADYIQHLKEYAEAAEWCNSSGLAYMKPVMSDDGGIVEYVECVGIEKDTKTEQAKDAMRAIRDRYLDEYVDKPTAHLLQWEGMSEEEQNNIREYRQYLLDYPNTASAWYKKEPLTLAEWLENKE